MRIDLHAHHHPPEYLDAWEKIATSEDSPRSRASLQLLNNKIRKNPAMWIIEERFPHMERAGVDMQVLALTASHIQADDPALELEMVQVINDSFAEICRKYPEKFIAVAAVPLSNMNNAYDELHRAVEKLGLKGVTIGSNVNGKPITSEEFLPIYEEINKLKLPIILHPTTPVGVEVMLEYNLFATSGFLLDTTLAVLRLIYTGIFEKYPDIKLVMPHLGGMALFTMGRIDNSYKTRPECRVNIPRPPSEYLKQFYYDDVSYHMPAFHCALESVGADHIVLGSDYPFDLADMDQSVKDVQLVGISEADQKKIYEDNARLIFGL